MDNTSFKYYWNLLIIVFAIYNMISIPMTLFFQEADYEENGGLNEHERLWSIFFWLNLVADLVFYIDMTFGFLTAYFNQQYGEYVYKPKRIAANYLKQDFMIDFLSTVHFELICRYIFRLPNPETNLSVRQLYSLFRFMKILKLVRIKRVPRIIKRLNDTKEQKSLYCYVFILFLLVLYIHCIACFMFFMLRQRKQLTEVSPIWSPAGEFGDLESGSIWKYPEVYEAYDANYDVSKPKEGSFSFLFYQYLTTMY
jgi:hypothetical protein